MVWRKYGCMERGVLWGELNSSLKEKTAMWKDRQQPCEENGYIDEKAAA